MTHPIEPRGSSYGDQLCNWVRAFADAREDALTAALEDGSSPQQVRMFTESNFGKRREKLIRSLEFLDGAFDDLEDLVSIYLREVLLVAYDTTGDEGERSLSWLGRARELTPSQQDYVACQLARLGVEAVARRDRRGHLRFQELWSVAAELAVEIERIPGLRIHLNPIRVWSRFTTPALLDDDAPLPADVVFFAARDTIRTAVLEADGRAMVEELASWGPCTLEEWAALSRHADREGIAALCRDLAEMGLVAFG